MSGRPEPAASPADDRRSLAVDVFLPHVLMSIGQGATAPMIALVAIDLGASVAMAGLIVGAFGLGSFLASIPGGLLASHVGDRRLMGLASSTMAAATAAVLTRPSLAIFGLLVALMGASTAVFGVGRLAHATALAPPHQRGRVMSTIGGTNRMGLFLGPILGGVFIGPLGLTGPFVVHAGLALVAASTAMFRRDRSQAAPRTDPSPRLSEVVRDHRRSFATAAVAVVALQIVRGARQALIPLWGDGVGLDPRQIGVLFSASAAVEILMFYPVGRLMDRRGRKWTAIPSLTLLSLGFIAIPLTSDFLTLGIVAAVIGLANGMGSGINQTLSSDLSPAYGRSVFLGLWRTITDMGTAGGPWIVALASTAVGLGFAAVVIGAVGMTGAVVMWRVVPETRPTP